MARLSTRSDLPWKFSTADLASDPSSPPVDG